MNTLFKLGLGQFERVGDIDLELRFNVRGQVDQLNQVGLIGIWVTLRMAYRKDREGMPNTNSTSSSNSNSNHNSKLPCLGRSGKGH